MLTSTVWKEWGGSGLSANIEETITKQTNNKGFSLGLGVLIAGLKFVQHKLLCQYAITSLYNRMRNRQLE